MTDVLCTQQDCVNYNDQGCTAKQIGHDMRQCITYRRVRHTDYKQLMRAPFKSGLAPNSRKSERTGIVMK